MMMRLRVVLSALVGSVVFQLSSLAGPISLTGSTHTETFDTIQYTENTFSHTPVNAELSERFWVGNGSAAFSAAAGTSDSGWWQNGTTGYIYARDGNANVNRAVSYGTGNSTERAFGLGWKDSAGTPISIGAQLQNDTGGVITNLQVIYDGELWYTGAAAGMGAADTLVFEYSLNATDLASGTWTPVTALNFTAPTASGRTQFTGYNGNDGANREAAITGVISGLNVANGSTLFIRWSNSNTHGVGIDNVSLTPNTAGGGGPPPVSGPPTFISTPTVKPLGVADTPYADSLTNDVQEADGDVVTYTKLSGPAWLNVATNGVIDGTPGVGDVGLNIFTVEAADVDGAATGTVHITVNGPTPPGGTVDVDVNWDIEHSVNGISDFDRENRITLHSAIRDPDWNGEEDKLDYLMNDLDVYFGRDNGSASWKFRATPEDPARPNMADTNWLSDFNAWWKTQYDADLDWHQYEPRGQGMIMGSNPHPTYPTLSWYPNGFADGWQPMDIATSAEWMVQYISEAFRTPGDTSGELPPQYWEVINEPDMTLMTGQFMVSNWESLWEYHNLVAEGVKASMGADAPLIGGMTWGLHDLWQGDLPRYDGQTYYDLIVGNPPSTDPAVIAGAEFYRDAGTTAYPTAGAYGSWEQWDIIWKGFIDHAGTNMDFYAVHFYDWPAWEVAGDGVLRAGGAVEATLDTLEWYDVHENGVSNRKPVVISEYGSVGPYQEQLGIDSKRVDWEAMKSFSSMFMQFLERPDYIAKSMPFTPVKAQWGDYTVDNVLYRYPYTMLRETSEGSGEWEWTEYIKWFELWSDVDGTRVDTKADDLDLQVDAYVDGNMGYLILNNLEPTNLVVNLNTFGLDSNTVTSVQLKHLYLNPSLGTDGQPELVDQVLMTAPASVEIGAEATMILCYEFANAQVPGETAQETKFYGESLSGTEPFRVSKGSTETLNAQINGVTVPAGEAEAVLRISGLFWYTHAANDDSRNVVTINGNTLDYHGDWRGEKGGRNQWFGTLELAVPKAYLQANNTITCEVLNDVTYSCVSLQVTDFSAAPGRSATAANVPVAGVSVSPSSLSMPEQRIDTVTAAISPADASDQRISWSSSDPSVATVDALGVITAVSVGTADITATTVDGGFSDYSTVTVTAFVPFEPGSVEVHPAARVIRAGETASLTETVLPANAADKSVSWSSDNTAVATVDSSGVVTAIAEGSAIITATTTVGGHTDTTVITVPPPIAVTGVGVSPAAALLGTGETLQLVESIQPSDAADPSVTWASLNPGIATVDSSGEVTGVSVGTAQIVVTTVDGGYTATNETTVFEYVLGGQQTVVEAETFFNTGGVSNSGVGINYVQANDWAEYLVTVPENGIYELEYRIASPNDDTGIEFRLDGLSLANDDVPNTGSWETYVPLLSSSYLDLLAGTYTARVVAASSPAWQWNLDKFTLTRVDAGSGIIGSVMALSIDGGNIIIGVTNGPMDTSFALFSRTNLTEGSWELVESNLMFDASGEAVISNTLNGLPQEFYKIDDNPGLPPSGITALFDWAEFSGNWWEGYNYAETNNGVVMVAAGRSSATATDGGAALKAAYAQDEEPGTFVIQIDGEDQPFRVNSIQIEANRIGGGVTNSWIPSVQGYLGGTNGVQVWEIIPTQNVGLQSYTSATSGDISQDIDIIIWNTGEAADPGATFGNLIDNLNVKLDTP